MSSILTYALWIVVLFYSLKILSFIKVWKKAVGKELHQKAILDQPTISVIVAMRNEEENILHLLNALNAQDYPKDKFQVILVDDHSEDQSVAIAQKSELEALKIIELKDVFSKKEAINRGVEASEAELILFTDADCIPHKQWISSMISNYRKGEKELILGPVLLIEEKGLFANFQSLDFLAMMSTGLASALNNKATLANGANLLISRSWFEQLNKHRKDSSLASGDDVFLLMAAKKENPSLLGVCLTKEAVVKTKGQPSWEALIQQRIRWASKSRTYRDMDLIYLSFLVLMVNLLPLLTFVFVLRGDIPSSFFLFPFILKSIIDYSFLNLAANQFGQQGVMRYFPVVVFIEPFFVVGLAFLSFVVRYEWKGRRGLR